MNFDYSEAEEYEADFAAAGPIEFDEPALVGLCARRACLDPRHHRVRDGLPAPLMDSMRRDLAALWQRSTASRDELVKQLQDWCQRAEASGIKKLAEFSRQLRSYG